MPLIERPKDGRPPFGSGAQILIGGALAQQLRQWKLRKQASSASPPRN